MRVWTGACGIVVALSCLSCDSGSGAPAPADAGVTVTPDGAASPDGAALPPDASGPVVTPDAATVAIATVRWGGGTRLEFAEGDIVEIVGRNFTVPSILNQITVGGVPVEDSIGTAETISFKIPTVPGIGVRGSNVPVVLRNANGTTSTTMRVAPRRESPVGSLALSYAVAPSGGTSGVLRPGQTYVLGLALDWTTSADGLYAASATVSQPGWQASVQTELPLALPRHWGSDAIVERPLAVAVSIPNDAVAGTVARLSVVVHDLHSASDVSFGTLNLELVVGSPPPSPRPGVSFFIEGITAAATVMDDNIQFWRDAAGAVSLGVHIQEGGTFHLEASLRNPTGWSAIQGLPVNYVNPTGPNRLRVSAIVTPGAGAQATDLLLKVVRDGEGVIGTYVLPLSVGP